MGTPIMPYCTPMYLPGCGVYGNNTTVRQTTYYNNPAAIRRFFIGDVTPYMKYPVMPFYPMAYNLGLFYGRCAAAAVNRNSDFQASSSSHSASSVSSPGTGKTEKTVKAEKKEPVKPTVEDYDDEDIETETSKTEKSKSKTNGSEKSSQSKTVTESNQLTGRSFVKIARKYSKCNENDGSHHKFCINPTCKREDPLDREWCTDFVTYVVKEAYKNAGEEVPDGFGEHDVKRLKKWAEKNGMFMRTSHLRKKGAYIATVINPGDIIIMNENKASHTGFVTYVEPNGVIHTIEGNRDDKVTEYRYSPNNPDISGFIRLLS